MATNRVERRLSLPRVPANVQAGQLRGRLDPALDEVGLAEVELLAEALRVYSPKLIVCSPVRRAAQTAAAIARATGAGILIDRDLVERDYGQWAGHTREEVVAKCGTLDQAPGVETRASLTHRPAASARPVVVLTPTRDALRATVALPEPASELAPRVAAEDGVAAAVAALESLLRSTHL